MNSNPIPFFVNPFILDSAIVVHCAREELPQPLQPISYAFPLTYGLKATRRAVEGVTLVEVFPWLSRALEHMARKTGKGSVTGSRESSLRKKSEGFQELFSVAVTYANSAALGNWLP